MAIIDKKFIHFKNYDDFISQAGVGSVDNITTPTSGSEESRNAVYGQIKGSSIVFIKDTKQIWTHGQLYDCMGNMSEQDPVFMASPAATITETKKTEWDSKQNIISDLDTIRSGAEKGATAVQPETIGSLQTAVDKKANDIDVVHLANAETISGVKTFSGRVNFLGSGDSNAMYLSTNTKLNVDGTTNTVLGFSSGTFLINNAAYNLTLRGKGTRPNYNNVTLALSSDIPAAVTESTVSGWGFTKNTGTITGVSANGTSVATSGVANIPAASTSAYGVTKLSSATNSTSTTLAATPSAVKAAYDLANSYKGTVTGVKINGNTSNPSNGVVDLGTVITSHQTLKTINGESIIGSGDITISGGSSDANVQAVDTGDVLDDVTVNYATKTYVDGLVGDINSILESIINS